MPKAEIISSESFKGRHNSNFDASSKRIREGGSWKKQRICVVLPSTDLIPAKVALSHWSLIFPPNQSVIRMLALGEEVGEAYSNCISEIIAHPELSKWEYVLTIECDNMPPSDGVVQLVKDMEEHPEFACIGGLYWCKGEQGTPHIWGDPKDPQINFRPQVPIAGGLQECCGTSMGFNLWRMSMLKDERLRRPWFKTIAGREGMGTQDLYFWGDARKYGYRCAVDTRVCVGHYDYEGKYGPRDTVW
jgi:hypothetical protein